MPKLTENMPNLLGKFKSLLDNIAGPGAASITEEAMAKETDPFKIKMMEVELLISQLNDIQVIQARTIHTLKTTYEEVRKMIAVQAAAEKSETTATTETKPATESENPEQSSEK
ncbi:MAG: hypothetical protein AB7F64_03090 [Gammaproteobacteria bacterium]